MGTLRTSQAASPVLSAAKLESDAVVPNTSIWLAGPRPSETDVGVRGFRYPSFDGGHATAVDTYVFILYVGGTTRIERELDADAERCEVGPGDISLQPPLVAARWRWASPIDVLHVYIDPSHVQAIASDELGAVPTLEMRHGLRIQDETLVQMGVDLIHEIAEPERLGSRRSTRALGDRMAIHLLRNYFVVGRLERSRHALAPAEERALREFIDGHLDDRLHVQDLARLVGLGVHHFSRVFRETFARAPHEYVRDRRLERARTLLVTTSRSIGEIAATTGFADQSHLTRCFKARFGVPPAALRRREA